MSSGYFLLARVSTGHQTGGHSLPTQLEAGRAYAGKLGVDIIAEYAETESGSTIRRDGLDDIRQRLASGEGRGIIVHTVDRLTRDPADLFTVRKELQQAGYAIHFVQRGGAAATPEQEVGEDLDAVFAKYERAKIRERTMRGMYGKVQSGQIPGHGPAPYGYRIEGQKRTAVLAHNPTEQAVLHRIKDMLLFERLSIVEIARRLTAAGVPTRADATGHKGKQQQGWHDGTLRRMLRNSVYGGIFYAHRFYKVNGKCRLRPRAEWVGVPVPPSFDDETWSAIQARMDELKKSSTRNSKRPYLLRCRMVCGCGAAMVGWSNTHGNAWYYRCGSSHTVRGRCGLSPLPGGIVDAAVWQWIRTVVLDPAHIRAQCARHNSDQAQARPDGAAAREQIDRELGKVRGQQQTLLDALLAGTFTLDEVGGRKAALDRELARLTQEQLALTAAPQLIPDEVTTALADYAAIIQDGLDDIASSVEDQQHLLSLLQFRATIQPGSVVQATCRLALQSLPLALDKPTPARSFINHSITITNQLFLA